MVQKYLNQNIIKVDGNELEEIKNTSECLNQNVMEEEQTKTNNTLKGNHYYEDFILLF